jgi:toxin CptA
MQPAVLQINPASRWQRGFLLLTHLVAALNAWWLDWRLAVVMNLLILVSVLWQWRQRPAVKQLQCLPDGGIEVETFAGMRYQVAVLPSSVLTAHVVVLHLKGDGKRLNLVIWPDSADAEVIRQWRVYLRWIWPALKVDK